MRRLTAAQQAAISRASRDRRSFRSAQRVRFWFSGVDHAPMLRSLDWTAEDAEEGNPAVVLTATIKGRIDPDEAKLRHCKVVWVVEGEAIPGYHAPIVAVEEAGRDTLITAATGGHDLDSTTIGEGPEDDVELAEARPDSALYRAVAALPYFGADLPRVNRPRIDARGPSRFTWNMPWSDYVGAIRERGDLSLVDSPLNVAGGRVAGGSRLSQQPVWTFVEGVDIPEDGEIVVEDAFERLYAKVLASRAEPNGSVSRVARAAVDNKGLPVSQSARLVVEVATGETEGGYEKVVRLAQAIQPGEKLITFPTAYAPLHLDRGDVVGVVRRQVTAGGVIERTYRGEIAKLNINGYTRRGEVVCRGRQIKEELVERVDAAPLVPAGGVIRQAVSRDHRGGVRIGLTEVAWIGRRGNGDLQIYDGAPAEYDEEAKELVLYDRG